MKTLLLTVLFVPLAFSQPTIRAGYFPYYGGDVTSLDPTLFTHLIYFYAPYQNIVDLVSPGPTDAQMTAMINFAHANGAKAMISINGWDWVGNFETDAARKNSCHLLRLWLEHWNMDGIDFDLEVTITPSQELEFMRLMRDTLNAMSAGRPISAYTHWGDDPSHWITNCWKPAADNGYLTFANVSAYDILGSWNANYVHGYSPLYGNYGGISVHDSYTTYKNLGFPMNKFLMGSSGSGYEWWGGTNLRLLDGTHASGGATWPAQVWDTSPNSAYDTRYDYNMLGACCGGTGARLWGRPVLHDDTTKQAFVSVDNAGSNTDTIFMFEDGKSLAAKWRFVSDSSAGGMYVWMAGSFYVPTLSPSDPWPVYTEWADSINQVQPPAADKTKYLRIRR